MSIYDPPENLIRCDVCNSTEFIRILQFTPFEDSVMIHAQSPLTSYRCLMCKTNIKIHNDD